MPEGKVDAPTVLPEAAQEIWKSAFDGAYTGTCKAKKSEEERDACSAAVAWSTVKEQYRKDAEGNWIERTFEECNIDTGKVPLPMSLYESPVSAGLFWCRAYVKRYNASNDLADAASDAWSKFKERYQEAEGGGWILKDGAMIEPVSAQPEDTETAEAEMAEPVVSRSIGMGASFRMEGTSIILDEVKPEDEAFLIRNHGHEVAECPRDWPWDNWIARPAHARTVAAVLRHKQECRAYAAAVERTKSKGWGSFPNPSGSGEIVFRGWELPEEGEGRMVMRRAVLVSKVDAGTDPEDWQLQVMASLQSSTLAARAAPGMKRFRGPVVK